MKTIQDYISQASGPYNSYWVYSPISKKAFFLCATAAQLVNRGYIVLCTGQQAMALPRYGVSKSIFNLGFGSQS